MNDKAYWIAFNQVSGIGPARLAALLQECGSIEQAWSANMVQMQAARLDRRSMENLIQARRTLDLAAVLQKVQQAGVQALCWTDQDYPAALRPLDDAPPLLYADGRLTAADEIAVAIVGTRRASAYGREIAHSLATELARAGVTVVSGLALGIDTVAHQAAIDGGGRTIAVLGSGVDMVYPAQNRRLAAAIRKQGAIVSEYPLGTRPEPRNFPPRNRIISGLSRAVVIVEAGERSGALITASFAAEHGREVFAVPGSILHPGSSGCNQLIQQGATPLLSVDDVLDYLDLTRLHEQQSARASLPPTGLEEQILAHLSQEPRHVDDLTRDLALPPGEVSSLLTIMELKGLVRQVAMLAYVRA